MESLRPELQIIAKFLHTELLTELKKRQHLASGKLEQSTEVIVMDIVNGFNIRGQYLYYGAFVEKGRRPGAKAVPIAALIEWIRYKKLRYPGRFKNANPWAIQAAIKKNGIKASKWQTDPLDKNINSIQEKIEVAAEKKLYLLVENMIQNTLKLIGND